MFQTDLLASIYSVYSNVSENARKPVKGPDKFILFSCHNI